MNTEIPVKLERLVEGAKHILKTLETVKADTEATLAAEDNPSKHTKDQFAAVVKEIENGVRVQSILLELLDDLKGHTSFSYIKVNINDFEKFGLWRTPPPDLNE
jgi:hypothetical protein